jgi:hypothetical protein
MSSKTPAADTAKPKTMPDDVRPIQVISVVEEIGELGAGIHFTELAEKTDVEIDVLLPILKTAEMLGLVRNEEGNLFLTEDGLRAQGTPMNKVSVLKERVSSIEPFRTAVELASKRGSTTAREVAETLTENGIQWHFKPERNETTVRNLLISWTIRADLLSYDGKTEKFQVASSGEDTSGDVHHA